MASAPGSNYIMMESSRCIEETPYRGYLSTMPMDAHFGLGKISRIDSMVVKWPDGKKQVFLNVAANQRMTVSYKTAKELYNWKNPPAPNHPWFQPITDSARIHYQHKKKDFIDFSIQKLLPHKFSEYGPAMAVGDVNNDGLDDIFIGGSGSNPTTLLLQQKDGTFINKNILPGQNKKNWDDMGLVLFDADNDGDLDLFIATGGYENAPNGPGV